MGKNDRFEKVYSQGSMNVMEIWVDKETGVNYLYHASGYSGGMTPYIPYVAKMYSQSTLSENQYFAITICVLFAPCLVGGLLGIVLEKFFGKRKILYFFILSLITYFVASFLGFGMISVKELIWLTLFLTSGFLLSDEKAWGCLFGMIPGIVFIWMSTNYTGQVINIELPLGLIIISFYLVCGAGIYRKCYLNKR